MCFNARINFFEQKLFYQEILCLKFNNYVSNRDYKPCTIVKKRERERESGMHSAGVQELLAALVLIAPTATLNRRLSGRCRLSVVVGPYQGYANKHAYSLQTKSLL